MYLMILICINTILIAFYLHILDWLYQKVVLIINIIMYNVIYFLELGYKEIQSIF